MKYPRPVFSKCPYRKNVPICRIADRTVLVEGSHDFLYEEMLKLLDLFRHESQQSCCNGNQHAYSFSNQTCNLYNWNKLLKYLWGCRSTLLSKFQAFVFELPGVFLMILIISLSHLSRNVKKKTLRCTFSRATKDQLNAHKPDTVTMSLNYYHQSSNYSINFYQATLTGWQRPVWLQFLEPCFLFTKKKKECQRKGIWLVQINYRK